jgi:hypothetical protein
MVVVELKIPTMSGNVDHVNHGFTKRIAERVFSWKRMDETPGQVLSTLFYTFTRGVRRGFFSVQFTSMIGASDLE